MVGHSCYCPLWFKLCLCGASFCICIFILLGLIFCLVIKVSNCFFNIFYAFVLLLVCSVCVYGGGDRKSQIDSVKKGVEIVIGQS